MYTRYNLQLNYLINHRGRSSVNVLNFFSLKAGVFVFALSPNLTSVGGDCDSDGCAEPELTKEQDVPCHHLR